ncbi:MAG: hypothetical protein AAF429_05905 [Pseudomonadota bacterium]
MTQIKTLLGGLLVAGMTTISAPEPAKAEVSGEELAAIIIGGTLLYSLGKNRAEKRARTVTEPAPAARPVATYYRHSHGRLGTHAHRRGVAHSHGQTTAVLPLPQQCERQVQVRNKVKKAYRANCLQRAGYRISNNGTVRHDRWIGRKAKPLLIYR